LGSHTCGARLSHSPKNGGRCILALNSCPTTNTLRTPSSLLQIARAPSVGIYQEHNINASTSRKNSIKVKQNSIEKHNERKRNFAVVF
jgi:hypothetical protein